MEKGIFLPKEQIVNVPFKDMEILKTKKGKDIIEYINVPFSYDIETTSFRNEKGEACAITYAHIFNIDGYCFKLETWEHSIIMFNYIAFRLGLNKYKRIVCYVHNLSYEFQFIKKQMPFDTVFSNGKERKILTALMKNGVEMRCSYMLAGASLAVVARNLNKYKIEKLVGDLDYSLIRTPETPLTEKELAYMLNDVIIIEYFIREQMEECNGIVGIPLTNTGHVRNYTRRNTIIGNKKENKEYRKLMKELKLEKNEYRMLNEAFGGGFTHANVEHVGKTMHNVTAKDFTSSYPARMIAYKFPMGKGEKYIPKDKKDFKENLSSHCCVFLIRFRGINRKANEGYLSASKGIKSKQVVVNNGRVESALEFTCYMTDMDFLCCMMSYDIDDFEVIMMYRYKSGYLPTPLVKSIIKLFADKTQLKGIDAKIVEYVRSKGMLNSLYGMSVQDVIQESFEWNDEEKQSYREMPNTDELLEKHNNSRKRFLFYAWGVWITAYARYDLFQDVIRLGDDYIYCDTDSIYYKNADKNEHIFENSNKRIIDQLQRACEHHGIDFEEVRPTDKKGKQHTIGLWTLDGQYDRFKTLGAKRYMIEKDGKINITVSGVNKNSAVPYLTETYSDVFEAFKEDLHIPEGACGKQTHTYVDEERSGSIIDHVGNEYHYNELSAINLEETSYTMTISSEYKEMIEAIQNPHI